MRRAFGLDVLVCPRCGRRLRLLGTIEDHAAIRAILERRVHRTRDHAPPPITLELTTLATQVQPTATWAIAHNEFDLAPCTSPSRPGPTSPTGSWL
jgi:hypothetical protein